MPACSVTCVSECKHNSFVRFASLCPLFVALTIVLLGCLGCGGGGSSEPGATAPTPAATAPTIAAQPQSVAVIAGQAATFAVSASGTTPLSYQWILNGTNIPGATSASYALPAVTSQQSGQIYSVVVNNSAGDVTSANATLMVNTSSTAKTVTAISGTITSTATTIVLPNIATVDFTGQSSLMGQTVSLAQVVDTS